jgi:hypothetical protein
MIRRFTVLTAFTVATALFAVPTAAQPTHVKVGTLSCDISSGIGVIVGSTRQVACTFTPSQPGPRELYMGHITNFGLDVGATTGGHMIWAVYAPTDRARFALAGTYGGASAQATVGVGVGANVLVGGSDRTVTLQPVSVQGQTGLNFAAGVAGLTLSPAR